MYMLGCRPCSSLIDRNHQICAQSGDSVDRETYQRLVGRLIYLCHISYAVSVVSRYMHDPRTGHGGGVSNPEILERDSRKGVVV